MGSIFAPNISAKTKAWSKNSKGQFVNDKGKVITGATMKGVDVSKWNGNINWKKVAKTDVSFAIIRCGYGSDSLDQDDKYWEKNVAGCVKYNIPFGTYIYSHAKTKKQATSEANHVLRLVEGKNLSFPIYYDMEENYQAKLGKTKVGKIANTFMNAIKAEGYQTGVYANLNWWNNYIPNSIAVDSTLFRWVARYNSYCGYKGSYNMWQCTSTGKVNGISGNVDINFWFGSYNKAWFKRYAVGTSGVRKPPRTKITKIKAGKRRLTVKWKKVKGAAGYQVKYSSFKKFKKYRIFNSQKNKMKFIKLSSYTRYYFKVRAYKKTSAGIKVYAAKWSKKKSKTTK